MFDLFSLLLINTYKVFFGKFRAVDFLFGAVGKGEKNTYLLVQSNMASWNLENPSIIDDCAT